MSQCILKYAKTRKEKKAKCLPKETKFLDLKVHVYQGCTFISRKMGEEKGCQPFSILYCFNDDGHGIVIY